MFFHSWHFFIKHGDFHYQLRARKCNSLPTSSELFGQHAERPFGTFRCNKAGSGGTTWWLLRIQKNVENVRTPPLYLIWSYFFGSFGILHQFLLAHDSNRGISCSTTPDRTCDTGDDFPPTCTSSRANLESTLVFNILAHALICLLGDRLVYSKPLGCISLACLEETPWLSSYKRL